MTVMKKTVTEAADSHLTVPTQKSHSAFNPAAPITRWRQHQPRPPARQPAALLRSWICTPFAPVHSSGDWGRDMHLLEADLKVKTLSIKHRSHCWAKYQKLSKKQQQEASERQTCYRQQVSGADSPCYPLQQVETRDDESEAGGSQPSRTTASARQDRDFGRSSQQPVSCN